MKRSVLILPSWYPSPESPINGIFIHDQAVALSRVYDVIVLVPQVMGLRKVLEQGVQPRWQLEQRDGLKICRTREIMLFPRALPGIYYRKYIRAAQRGFEKAVTVWGKPNLIHAHVVLPAGWAAVRLGKQHAIPVVLTEHSSPFSVHLATERQRRLVADTLTRVDRVVAVSPALVKQIHAFQATNIAVIGNLIRTEFFVPPTSDHDEALGRRARFLFVGLLTQQKGLVYLLKAVQMLVQRGSTAFELVIGGDGPDRAVLERAACDLGIADRCRFLGLLTPGQVRDWMQWCDVFVLPSVHETFGIVLGEAMACGKPVLATRCGGAEFVVTPETGVLVNKADPAALADAMDGFMRGQFRFDPRLVRQSVVERFGEEAFLRNVMTLYEQVWSNTR